MPEDTGDEPMVTKTGRVLTDADVEALSAEAEQQEYPDAPEEAHARLAEALRTRGIHASKPDDVALGELFFDTKIKPRLLEIGIDPERIVRVRTRFLVDVAAARDEVRRARPERKFKMQTGETTTDAEMEAIIQAARESSDDETLALRYWDQHIRPGLLDDIPERALGMMRENYVADVMASPGAREQLRTIYG